MGSNREKEWVTVPLGLASYRECREPRGWDPPNKNPNIQDAPSNISNKNKSSLSLDEQNACRNKRWVSWANVLRCKRITLPAVTTRLIDRSLNRVASSRIRSSKDEGFIGRNIVRVDRSVMSHEHRERKKEEREAFFRSRLFFLYLRGPTGGVRKGGIWNCNELNMTSGDSLVGGRVTSSSLRGGDTQR